MSTTLPRLFLAVGALLMVAGTAHARPNFRTKVAPSLARALNRTQNLKQYRSQYYTTDYRASAKNFQRPRKLRRAPKYDKAGMKAWIFGVRAVTPHTKTFSRGSEVMATAVRRIVGVVLVDRKGKPTLDAENLRIKRLDKIDLKPLFGG
jgi:hypothetical protein